MQDKSEPFHSYIRFRKPSVGIGEEKQLAVLLNNNLIEAHGNRLRRGGRNYAVTTCGLLYILSQGHFFTRNLLTRYSENIILRQLLFKYIEENTIKNSSPRVLITISRYLHKCCLASMRTLHMIKKSEISQERINHTRLLELEIKGLALSLGLRLTRACCIRNKDYTNTKYDMKSQADTKMFNHLLKDTKFSLFRSTLLNELAEAFEELNRLNN